MRKGNKAKPDQSYAQKLNTMVSELAHRVRLAGLSGKQFGGDRDLYTVLGYKRTLRPLDFLDMYYRDDIAQRIIHAFPQATWRAIPEIIEGEKREDTKFELAVDELVDNLRLWQYCERADRLCGLGRYSILILGTNDGAKLSEPLVKASQLHWLRPVPEAYAEVSTWVQDPMSPKFGQPEIYSVTFGSEEASTMPQRLERVHHSRVIHIAEHTGMDDVFGIPRLECVYNRIFDLQKVVGGSAEMFWLGARNGLVFEANEDAQLSTTEIDALEDDAEAYQHQLRRLLTSSGGKWRVLESQKPEPAENMEGILNLIAGGTGIPQRILIGSESGELASSQDENSWLSRIAERRTNFADPVVIRALLDRLVELGILPPPTSGKYNVQWPKSTGLSEKEQAEIASIKSTAIVNYANSPSAGQIVTESEFRELIMGMEPEPPGGFPDDEELPEEDYTPPAFGDAEQEEETA